MDTTLAYLAGFFDGEGCIVIMKYTNRDTYGLRSQLSQNDQKPLDLAMKVFPGGKLYTRPASRILNVQWHGVPAYEMLSSMLPYLMVKRTQAELAIEFGELVIAKRENRTAYTAEDKARMLEIREAIQVANRGGRNG